MASWGGGLQKGGSSRLSRLVTDIHSTAESRKGLESLPRAGGASGNHHPGDAGVQSEEEEEEISEDEEEL